MMYSREHKAVFIVIILILFVGIAVFASSGMRNDIYQRSNELLKRHGFEVVDIEINDLLYADGDKITRLLNSVAVELNILYWDFPKIEQEIMKFGWVKHVEIKRKSMHVIKVKITEHEPKAYYQTNQGFNIVDYEAETIVSLDDISKYQGMLPQLVGEGALINAQEIIEILSMSAEFYKKIRIIERIGKRRWDLILRDDVVVKLPADNVQENWEYFLNFEEEFNVLNTDIKSIDLRTKDRLFIEFDKDLDNIKVLQ